VKPWRFSAEFAIAECRVKVYQYRERDGGHQFVTPVNEVTEQDRNTVAAGDLALLSLERDDAQKLVDALYAAGIRPTDARDRSSEIGALQANLQDLRRLVFGDYRLRHRDE
jgi:hypothetical protein